MSPRASSATQRTSQHRIKPLAQSHSTSTAMMSKTLETPSPITPSKPYMVALAGWPEPIYVSSGPTDWSKRKSRPNSPPLPPLDSGVGDGVPSTSTTTSTTTLHSLWAGTGPFISPPNLGQADVAVKSEVSTGKLPVGVEMSNTPRFDTKTNIASFTASASTATATVTSSESSNQSVPVAPPASIFATTCRHLLDPSLGPCPFPTHPHDIKALYPPTSHLPRSKYSKAATSSSASSSSSSSTSTSPLAKIIAAREKKELEDKDDKIKEAGLVSPPPAPLDADTMAMPPPPLPLSTSSTKPTSGSSSPASAPSSPILPSSSSAASSMSSTSVVGSKKLRAGPNPSLKANVGLNGGKIRRSKGAFNDPRYGPTAGILHKGRALPVVPTWSTSEGSSRLLSILNTPATESGTDGGRFVLRATSEMYPPQKYQVADDLMDVDD